MFLFVWSNNNANNGTLPYAIGIVLFLLQMLNFVLPPVALVVIIVLCIVGATVLLSLSSSARDFFSDNDVNRRTTDGNDRNSSNTSDQNDDNNNDNNLLQSLLVIFGLPIVTLILWSLFSNNSDSRSSRSTLTPTTIERMESSVGRIGVNMIQYVHLSLIVFIIFLGFVIIINMIFGDAIGRRQGTQHSYSNTNIDQIIQMVSTMPIEEYVHQNNIDKCSISQLRKMFEVRSNKESSSSSKGSGNVEGKKLVFDSFVERKEVEDALKELRKHNNDSCCICFEKYESGDSIRILPRCCHEFHVECIDQW